LKGIVVNERPFPLEDFLASVAEGLRVRGDARAIAAIVEGECQFQPWDSDFGIDMWKLMISLPVHIFYALSDDERKATEAAIKDVGEPFFTSTPQDALGSVVITPRITSPNDGWREEAMRFAKGEGLTNQGRVRSDNIAAKQYQGLLFRSQAEIMLFEAMTRAQLAVSPLPVFVRIGKKYNRIEPDFVVVYKGLTFVVEVDGDSYHKELPAEADKRLVPLTYEGVEVRRIRASELATDVAADAVVRDLIQFMSRRKESR
jgi:very-short-patch-repair endonuclease